MIVLREFRNYTHSPSDTWFHRLRQFTEGDYDTFGSPDPTVSVKGR